MGAVSRVLPAPVSASVARLRVDPLDVTVGLAAALSATLLFLAQPLFARAALPLFGGGAAVWTASLAFAQAALLAGYAYAHLAGRLPLHVQVGAHLLLMLAVLTTLPLGVPSALVPDPSATGFVRLAATRLGPALTVLAATGILLQRWLARARPASPDGAYAQYAAGSAGSLLGLLSYPFVVEPLADLSGQAALWTAGYLSLIIAVAWSAIVVLRTLPPTDRTVLRVLTGGARRAGRAGRSHTLTFSGAARCIALAAAPSGLALDNQWNRKPE